MKLVNWVTIVKLVSAHFFDIWTSKKAQYPQFLILLTSKCASRHNGVHFFDIWTSKSGPSPSVFYTFDLETRFAPQRRATFSSLILPDGSAPAALASLLFECPEPPISRKTQWIATFLPFRASASSFFSLFLSSDLASPLWLFSPLLFHLSILSDVGSLTSKLPSIIYMGLWWPPAAT